MRRETQSPMEHVMNAYGGRVCMTEQEKRKGHGKWEIKGQMLVDNRVNTEARDIWKQRIGYLLLHTFWRFGVGVFDTGEGSCGVKELGTLIMHLPSHLHSTWKVIFIRRVVLTNTYICR